jgi:hypothetical protein
VTAPVRAPDETVKPDCRITKVERARCTTVSTSVSAWASGAGLFNLLNESRVMLGNNGVEGGLLRLMAVIGGSGGNRGRSEHQAGTM